MSTPTIEMLAEELIELRRRVVSLELHRDAIAVRVDRIHDQMLSNVERLTALITTQVGTTGQLLSSVSNLMESVKLLHEIIRP